MTNSNLYSFNRKVEKKNSGEKQIEQIKEILMMLGKTISQMKIFSFSHPGAKKFSDNLYDKLKNYLDKYLKLEIGIEETFFTFQGENVYSDEKLNRSLPFIFFKDGMQILFFYKELKTEELLEFLEIIKKNFELPPEKRDIVSDLWEKDFANIRYYAPDNFLETIIRVGIESADYSIDPKKLSTGKIKLSPKGKKKIEDRSSIISVLEKGKEIETETKVDSKHKIDTQTTSLSDKETKNLESLIDSNRKISPEDELTSLFMEILYLEKRSSQFTATLEILEQCLQDFIKKGNFYRAFQIVNSVQELKQSFSGSSKKKIRLINEFLEETRNRKSLSMIEDLSKRLNASDIDDFLAYLKELGPQILPLLSRLYEEGKETYFNERILNCIKEIGKESIPSLMNIVQNEKPSLTNEIISLISKSGHKKTLQFLASFAGYSNKPIKCEAIRALGKFKKDETANKILATFLKDSDEGIRILAYQNLHYFRESFFLDQIITMVGHKSFIKKNGLEKKAILDFLSTTRDADACSSIKNFIKNPGIFQRSKKFETCFLAISALQDMQTQEAIKALKDSRRIRNKKIRHACLSAIEEIESKKNFNKKVLS